MSQSALPEYELRDVVESALARALVLAGEARRWELVAQIAAELAARRRTRERQRRPTRPERPVSSKVGGSSGWSLSIAIASVRTPDAPVGVRPKFSSRSTTSSGGTMPRPASGSSVAPASGGDGERAREDLAPRGGEEDAHGAGLAVDPRRRARDALARRALNVVVVLMACVIVAAKPLSRDRRTFR